LRYRLKQHVQLGGSMVSVRRSCSGTPVLSRAGRDLIALPVDDSVAGFETLNHHNPTSGTATTSMVSRADVIEIKSN